ncbi:hypothetical protein AB0K89_10600 [Streptomyces cinnamoneus]|uniref:hypothetical protein n=1 Tax=Streptomyces cinnamoneus TaxID=53446 RepID=UPI003445FB61
MTAVPPPTEPFATRDVQPRIAYFTFLLRGLEDGADPQSACGSAPKRWTVLRGPGGAVFRCGSTDFRPHVRLEAWRGEPPALPGGWDTVDTVEFRLHDSGTVRIEEWDGRPAGDPVDLGGPGAYRLRAASRGREAARLRHAAGETHFHGAEEWLLQLWPR